MTACKQVPSSSNADGESGVANSVLKFTKNSNGDDFILNGSNGVSFKMKKIPAVTDGTIGIDDQDDTQPHKVSLSEYYLGETEVTQELYEAIMGANPIDFQGSEKPPADGEEQAKRLVEQITWYEAVAFCNG